MKTMFRKSLVTLAVTAAMAAPAAYAATPTLGDFTYDNTLATGIDGSGISLSGTGNAGLAGCAAGFTCSSSVVSDKGFLQVQMTEDGTGKTYFQTIIADDGANAMMGNLRSDSFVGTQASGAESGVAALQTINAGMGGVDNTGMDNDGLSSTATLLTGGYDDGNTASISLGQTLWDNTAETSAGAADSTKFDTTFGFTKANEASPMGMTTVTAAIADQALGFDNDFYVGMRMAMAGDVVAGEITAGDMLMDVGVTQQTLAGSAAGGDEFVDSFKLASTINETTETMVAKVVDIASDVQLTETGSAADSTFDYALRMGIDPGMVPTGTLAATVYGGFDGVQAGAVDVNGAVAGGENGWVDGDTIAQVLIGQDTGEGQFGFNSVADLTDVDGAGVDDMGMEEYSSLSSTGPFVNYYEADGVTVDATPEF